MFAERFDGLDFVVQTVQRAAPLVALYGDVLGFEIVADDQPAPTGLAHLLGLPDDVTRLVHLQRSGTVGGDILLAESATATAPLPGPPPRRPGVYALDFYLRDAAATEQAISEAGWTFCSEAVHYDLPGTTIPVRERMLQQRDAGLLHAMVQHRPGGTRSILSEPADDGWCSEIVAIVVLTANLAGARRFATEILGGHEYFAGTFSGAAVERMLDYEPGEGLEASLYRGPRSRNARLEFARPVDGAGNPLPMAAPRNARDVQPGMLVADLDALRARLDDGQHGQIAAEGEFAWLGRGRRAVRFETAYDVDFLLVESPQLRQ